MLGRDSLRKRLERVRQVYFNEFNGDQDELRKALPANEVWRFFVERVKQRHGRWLERSIPRMLDVRELPEQYKHLTIKEFTEENESVSIETQQDWENTGFSTGLRNRQWRFEQNEWGQYTLHDLIELDRGWLPFEINEPNYFAGVYQGFDQIFDLDQSLSIDLLLSLHRAVTDRVEGLASDFSSKDSGRFRQQKERAFLLLPDSSVSEQGLYEYVINNDETEHFVDLQFYFPEARKIIQMEMRLNKDALSAIREYYKDPGKYTSKLPFERYVDKESRHSLVSLIKNDSRISVIFETLGSKNANEAVQFIFQMVKTQPELYGVEFTASQKHIEFDRLGQYLSDKASQYIDEYHTSIEKEKNPLKKLECIAVLIQQEELLHPFTDANGRTICMLLLNFLLMKNDFPPAILNDSNRFNIYSRQEMVEELIKGMENTLYMAKHKELYGFRCDELYQNLSSPDLIKDKLEYMNQLFEREERLRRKKDLLLDK